MAPKKKADYAFLLHDLYHIKPKGIMTIVLPHGVLFRGGSELEIRKNLIENDKIDVIIGLPSNIFFGTGIPIIIMVLKQKRENNDVLIIDASKGFEKVGKNNKLRSSDIKKIVDAIIESKDIEKVSKVVIKEEIRINNYNLNISHYVDTSVEKETYDLYASMFGGVPDSELNKYKVVFDELSTLKSKLFKKINDNYLDINTDDIEKCISDDESTKKSILTNEKYKGDALLQKQYTVDFLTKKRKTNEGEIPQYYVTDDHEPIIDKKTFDLVQIEREKRNGVSYSGTDVFANKIVCGECGSQFGKKVWHSNDKYRCVVYRCNKKYNGKKCSTGHVTEDEIKEKFVEAYNSLDRTGVVRNVENIKQVLMSSDKEKAEQKKLQGEYDKCEKKLYKLIEENSTHAQNQDEYNKKYRDLADKSTKIQEKLDKITATFKDKDDRVKVLETYINDLKASKNKLTDFDEGLFYALVDRVKVNKNEIKIIWKDGTES